MTDVTQFGALVIIIITVVLNVAANWLIRRRTLNQRHIAAYDVIPAITGESIEASRPVHISLGSAAPGTDTTLLAMAGAEFAYYTAQKLTISDASPLISVTETAAMPLAVDVMRMAYQSRGLLAERFRPVNVRWYPAGIRSLAFIGGITAMQLEENVAANFLVGSFGAEIALMLETSRRQKRPTLAVSDRLEGQAVAYAMADYPLIGEEIFAAGGYLSGQRQRLQRNALLDIGRWILIAALVVMVILNFINRPTGA